MGSSRPLVGFRYVDAKPVGSGSNIGVSPQTRLPAKWAHERKPAAHILVSYYIDLYPNVVRWGGGTSLFWQPPALGCIFFGLVGAKLTLGVHGTEGEEGRRGGSFRGGSRATWRLGVDFAAEPKKPVP